MWIKNNHYFFSIIRERISKKYIKLQKELEDYREIITKLQKCEENSKEEIKLLNKTINTWKKKAEELEKEVSEIIIFINQIRTVFIIIIIFFFRKKNFLV